MNERGAEIERGVLGRQCLDQRIPELKLLTSEVAAWIEHRDEQQVRVNWQFTTADARIKLKRLSPVLDPIISKLADHSEQLLDSLTGLDVNFNLGDTD